MQRLTEREEQALSYCVKHLDKVEPYRDKPDPTNPTRGKCYIASVALLEYLGGAKAGYKLIKAIYEHGDHYWVQSKTTGAILDPTIEQFEIMGVKPPYGLGKGVGRRNTFKAYLPLLDAMQAETVVNGAEVDGSRWRRPEEDLFCRHGLVSKEVGSAVLTSAQEEMLTRAFRAQIANWRDNPEEFIRVNFSKGALALHFVRALLYGDEVPRSATMAYVPHRFYVAGSAHPFSDVFEAAFHEPDATDEERERADAVVRGIRFVLSGDATFSKLIASNLPILGYRIPNDFPISLARVLIDKYCPASGRVLDPCHGWGGRLVGFMLSKARSYVGVDPAPHSPCLREMFSDLKQYVSTEKVCKLINKPFEDVVLTAEAYDFALTSPPYFNIEKYDGEESSWRRYKTADAWFDGFYASLIEGVAAALRPGAYFALQVTPKPFGKNSRDMVSEARKVGREVGLVYDKVHDTTMRRYNSVTADKEGSSTDQFEVVVIFRKE